MAISSDDIQTASTREATEWSLGVSRRRMASRARPDEVAAARDRDQARAMRVWLALVVFIALMLRLLLFALGPATDLHRAIDPVAAQTLHLSLNTTPSTDETEIHSASAEQSPSAKADEVKPPAEAPKHNAPPSLLAHDATDGATHAAAKPESAAASADSAASTASTASTASPTPAYRWLLTAAMGLRWPVMSVLLLQIVAGTLTVALVYWLGCSVLRHRWAALLAAAVVAVHPAGLIAPIALTPQTFFTLFLLLGLCLAAERRGRDPGDGMVGGLSLGAAALFKPLTLWAGPVVALWMVLYDRRLKTIGAAVALGLVSFALPAGWLVYNHQTQGMGSLSALASSAVIHTPSGELEHQLTRFFVTPSLDDLSRRLGLALPDEAQAAAVAAAPSSSATPTVSDVRHWLMLGWSGLNALLMMTAAAGVVLLVWRRRWAVLLALGGALAWFLLTWPGGDAERWRLPVLGVQALLAGSILMPSPRSRIMPWVRRRFKRKSQPEQEAVTVLPPRPGLAGRPL